MTAVRNTSPFLILPVYSVLSHQIAILEIEEMAKLWKSVAQTKRPYQAQKSAFWTEEEDIELFTRWMIRDNLVDLMSKQVSATDLEALKRVLFTISYPIVDMR